MIAVVVPTIREEQLKKFLEAWESLFKKHNVSLYIVKDGENPTVNGTTLESVMGKDKDLIYNFNDGVRNLGFYQAYKDGADIIISLDDDVLPDGDTIQDHLDALSKKYPISWMNTVHEVFMRGFPYSLRDESECVLSHGAWKGVADFDASTQLVIGTPEVTPRRMPIPKGVLFPMCIMNVAFKRELTPYFYQAPMYGNINRFADIWSGIEVKKVIDARGWAAVTGYATVHHNRASDPFINLQKEARGVSMNEKYGEGDYFIEYEKLRTRWFNLLTGAETK